MQGVYFDKKQWDGAALPQWERVKDILPEPILEGEDDALAAYWRSWEIAIRSMKSPLPGSGFVSNFMYMEFSKCIFAHDTAFMVMFGRYGLRAFSAAESLDNFYARQHETGEICREIQLTGPDYWVNRHGDRLRIDQTQDHKGYWWTRPNPEKSPTPHCAMEGLNDPSALLWGEWYWYEITGDKQRLERVLPAQVKWFEAFNTYVRDTCGLYITDWATLDNAPRNECDLGYAVDLATQAAFHAELLARVYRELGRPEEARPYQQAFDELSTLIRGTMWDESAGLFFDLDRRMQQIRIKAIMGMFPLVAGITTPAQAARIVEHLNDARTFNRPVRVPTLAADEPMYFGGGSYLLGGVFPFTNQYVIEGLERYGYADLAAEIALNFWRASVQVFKGTGTVWEFIAPEFFDGRASQGRTVDPWNTGHNARGDFAGWGAQAPIEHLLEYAIGLRPHAPSHTLTWNLRTMKACGCNRYAFGDVTADLLCEGRKSADDEPVVRIKTNRPFTLRVNWGSNKSKSIKAH